MIAVNCKQYITDTNWSLKNKMLTVWRYYSTAHGEMHFSIELILSATTYALLTVGYSVKVTSLDSFEMFTNTSQSRRKSHFFRLLPKTYMHEESIRVRVSIYLVPMLAFWLIMPCDLSPKDGNSVFI